MIKNISLGVISPGWQSRRYYSLYSPTTQINADNYPENKPLWFQAACSTEDTGIFCHWGDWQSFLLGNSRRHNAHLFPLLIHQEAATIECFRKEATTSQPHMYPDRQLMAAPQVHALQMWMHWTHPCLRYWRLCHSELVHNLGQKTRSLWACLLSGH